MFQISKSMLQKILAVLARIAIKKYKPAVIGVTGSVGKTSARQAIFTVLKSKYRVRTAEKNYNNEIGLPLAVLGIPHCGRSVFKWVFALTGSALRLIFGERRYPEILVLEYGVSRPGDMDYLLSVAKPRIAVITAIGEIPAHIEFFKDEAELAAEKAKILEALPADGCAVLNHDDYAVYDMKEKTKRRVITYGTEERAEIKIANYKLQTAKDEKLGEVPFGSNFKIEYDGKVVPVRLDKIFGMPQAYASAAAFAAGMEMNMNMVEIAEALQKFVPPAGRLRLIEGIKRSFIVDDTYNASPESMRAALEILKALPGKRKIAVLGDMLELGRYSEEAHRSVGDLAAEFVDLLFAVGPRAKFIADEAATRGIEKSGRRLAAKQIFKFNDAVSAGKTLDPALKEGDLILVKGSQAMRMEKAVEEIMLEPEKAAELLVRQEKYWKK